MSTALVPTSMTFAEAAARAAAAQRRLARRPRKAPARREAGYKGYEFSRLTYDWVGTRTHPDEEVKNAIARLRARARDLSRNNSYVRQYLNLLRWNVIGPDGMKLQAQVRDNSGDPNERINERIEEGWADWGTAPTVDGRQDFVEFSQLCLQTVANEGEVFIRLHRGFPGNRYGLALEAIDPDRVDEMYFRYPGADGNEIRMGVEIDRYGRAVAYHIWDSPVGLVGVVPEMRRERVPADQIIHLYRLDRTNQTRGVTWHAPVMFALKMLDGYEEAELVGARLAASSMGIFTRKEEGAPAATDADGKIEFEANPGSFIVGPEGYDLNTWDPQRPGSNVQSFIKSMLRKIASGWGVSYNVLANDLEGVNYSSMRSGLLSERDTWRSHQHWLIAAFCRPVYREWMGMALLTGGLVLDSRAPGRFLAARWVPRGWAWVDPKKDSEAGILEIGAGLTSRTELLAEQGKDLEEIFEHLRDEKRLAAQYGIEITAPPAAAGAATTAPPPDEGDGEDTTARSRLTVLAAGNGHVKGGRHG